MEPFSFEPILRRIRWGGRRLGTVLGKALGPEPDYAESWEISDHGDDQSIVCRGPYQGWTLSRLVRERGPELLGSYAGRTQFPLLVKFLDACDRLSVQVHPNDDQACGFDPDENGKTEAWVIVDAEPESRLYVGLKPGVNRATFEECIANGTVAECLHSFRVKPGDCVFIPAGTVHAIGEGILLAEVQQSSDLTFRIHDWGRVDADGKLRKLHIEQALACIDFDRGPVDPVPLREGDASRGCEELVQCDHFCLRRYATKEPFTVPSADRFHVLMILAGQADVRSGEFSQMLIKGQTILLPAAAADMMITPAGEVVVLEAFLP